MVEPPRYRRARLFAAAALGFCLSATAAAQPQLGGDGLLVVTGERFEYVPAERVAYITGAPIATQGDVRLAAERFEVYFTAEETSAGDAAGDIEKLYAIGEVRYATPDEIATGDYGVYDASSRLITLTGDVVVTRGGNVLRGGKLVINVDDGRSVMQGEGGRVRGVFITNSSAQGS